MTETLIEPFVERRREPRLRSLLAGMIAYEDDKSTFDCVIRSISAHGARVEMAEVFRLPEEFNLNVPHHAAVHHAVLIWRQGERAGLALSDITDQPRKCVRRSRQEMLQTYI
jgi:hypothetical protein